MSDSPSAVIVGAGVFGASVADALSARGWAVTVVEQYAPGNVRGSSWGSSRLTRVAHGAVDPDDWYTSWAWKSQLRWREIGEEEQVELYVESGLVWFARQPDGYEAASVPALTRLGLPFERLAPEDARRFYPDVRTDDVAFVLHEPRSGIVRARVSVQTLLRRAQRRGATMRIGRCVPDERGRAVVDGEVVHADRTIWACGAWLGALFPQHTVVRPTRQSLCYFGVDAAWQTPGVPAWISDGGPAAAFGLGDFDGGGFKVSWGHQQGPLIDPDSMHRLLDPAVEAGARRILSGLFPSIAQAPLVASHVGQYELTPDHHFVIAPLPDDVGAWLVGGGSGHGFKHGPMLGEHVADLMEGRAEPRPLFGLGRRAANPT